MGDFKRLRLNLLCPLLPPLLACGLEREYDTYKKLAESASRTTGSEITIETASSGEPADESTSTSTSGGGQDLTTLTTLTTSSGTTGLDTSMGATLGPTTSPAAVCGNGLMESEEECDALDDLHCHDCVRDRLVFVTSQMVVGDFASDKDLDYTCNHLAAIAGLMVDDPQRRFRAWISTSSASAADRLHHSRGRYVLRNDTVFAQNWDAIVSGELQSPLNITEWNAVRSVAVWTETLSDGSAIAGTTYCQDWSADDFGLYATWGHSDYIDERWTQWPDSAVNPTDCSGMAAFYCFEQG